MCLMERNNYALDRTSSGGGGRSVSLVADVGRDMLQSAADAT